MIHFTLVVIIVNAGVAQSAPVVQEQPIVQKPEPGFSMRYDCPDCGWWNTYDDMTAFKIGSRAHFRRCPKR
jgi:hypothetical protein